MTSECVVVLFTDIVSSTALASRLAIDDADEIRRRHFVILRRVLAENGGREVKHLGDGLMAAFGSPSAALTAAVAMQQRVERDNRTQEHAIGLRAGLSGGEVTPDEGDYFGDPVIEAARLCAKCVGGQILAARVVPLMAGRRNPYELRPVGRLALAGLPEPVATVEVLWPPLPEADAGVMIPLPARLSFRPSTGVVGRDDEAGVIEGAFRRVAAGGGHETLLIGGEAGLGKTTLVAESARAALEHGACVLFGHCEEDLAAPYQLFGESLGHYVAHAPDALLTDHVNGHGSELARLVPALAGRMPELAPSKASDADTERYLLFAAVVGVLAALSTTSVVVLVLDDLQWADAGSLALLRHIVASEQPMRVLILGTYRDSELATADHLRDTLGMLHRHRGMTKIELAGLGRAGVTAFIEAAAGHGLDAQGRAFADDIHLETDGNPFFVSELLRHYSETGAITRDARGRWVTTDVFEQLPLPTSVRDVVAGRVARLGPDATRLLSVAAVVGRDFDLDTLTTVTSVRADEALDALDAAAAAALVREVGGAPGHYTFAHALIQHTVYEGLGTTRRAHTHRLVAEALEALGDARSLARVRQLAHHWALASTPPGSTKAIEYLRLAADAALAALAPGEALAYYAHASELCRGLDDPDARLVLDLSIGLGTAQRQTGDAAFRETLLDAARQAVELGDTDRLVAAVLANDRGFYSAVGTTDAEKVSALETALAALPADRPDRALVLASLCSELAHGSTLECRQSLADEAIAIAERVGDDTTVVRVLNHLYIPLQVPHLVELAVERTTHALVTAQRLGDPAMVFWSVMWRGETAARVGDVDELDRCLELHGAIAEHLAEPTFVWAHKFSLGCRALIAGDTDRAEALAGEALQIGSDSGQPDAALIYGAQLMNVSGQRGTMHELIPLIEQMSVDAPDISPWLFGSLLAKAHVEVGRVDDARGKLEEFAAVDFELPLDQIYLTGMVDYAEAAIECGDLRFARPLFEHLEPWAALLPATGASALAPVSLYLGGLATVLGRYEAAETYLAQAAAMCRRMDAKFFAARAALLRGRMLVARDGPGDIDRAVRLLTRAHDDAADRKYGGVLRLAERELRQLGE